MQFMCLDNLLKGHNCVSAGKVEETVMYVLDAWSLQSRNKEATRSLLYFTAKLFVAVFYSPECLQAGPEQISFSW